MGRKMKLLVSLLIAFATLTHSLPLQDQKTDIAKTSFDLSSDTVDLSLPNEEPVLTRNRRRTKSQKNATARKNEIKTGTAHDVAKKNGDEKAILVRILPTLEATASEALIESQPDITEVK